jgi:ubiquinone/menaquinone biosynthesis C-methylase UbiE
LVNKGEEDRIRDKHVLSDDERSRRTQIVRRSWAKQVSRYDKSMGFIERKLLGPEHRQWAAGKAEGDTLEVAIGTGLNITHYTADTRLSGIDLSPEMLDLARARGRELNRQIDLRVGDAHELPYPDRSFDAVVCTYSLCNIPDHGLALSEMKRVLRSGGKLILVDHVRSSFAPLFWFQRFIEFFTLRLQGETQTRRPLEQVVNAGFEITERDRMHAGVVERLVAVNQGAPVSDPTATRDHS